MKKFYNEYESGNDSFLDEENSEYECEQMEVRELEIDDGIYEFMSIILPESCWLQQSDFEMICSDFKEHVCEYLWKKHQVSVYRPMYLENEYGLDVFVEYPYEVMDF